MSTLRFSIVAVGALAFVVAAALLSSARGAEAHALLLTSDPPQNGQLTAAPSIVTTFYSETLDTNLSSLQVLSGNGDRVDDGETQFDAGDAAKMSIAIEGELGPGFYQVVWETLSAVDGHLFRGSYPFTVLNPDGSQPSGPKLDEIGSSGTVAEPDTVAVRWARILGIAALVGALAFAAWVVNPSLKDVSDPWRGRWRAAARQRTIWVALSAAGALAVVAIAELYVQADQFGGTGFVDDVLDTDWGTRWMQRQIVLACVCVTFAAGLAFGERRRWAFDAAVWVALVGGLLYILLVALTTHADTIPGKFWAVGADFLHIVAASVWIGMLLQLMLFLFWLRRDIPEDDRTKLQAGHLQRFSVIAASSVTILLATGVANAASQIPDFSSLWETAYGRALLVKLGVLAALLLAAATNAFYLRPRIVEDSEDGLPTADLRRRMQIAVRVELLLGVAVILAAAILVLYPTSRQIRDVEAVQDAGPQAVVGYQVTQPAGDLEINLTVSPNQPGQNSFRAFVLPSPGEDLGEILRVRLRFHYREQDLGQSEVVMETAGSALAFRAVGPFLSQAGTWDVDVDVRRAEVDDVTATFPVEVGGSGGAGQYALPLTVGSWLTVAAALMLVVALLVGIWANDWPNFPTPSPRLVRVGTAAFSVVGVGLFVLSFIPGDETVRGNPIKSSDESIAIGRMLYQQNCQQCHGADGRGDGPLADTLPVRPADFRVHIPYHPGADGDDLLFNIITNGLGTIMPSFEATLTDDERWHLLNFLRSEFGQQDGLLSPTPTPVPSP